MYRKVLSSNTSRLETHAGFFRLLMKGIFDPFDKKLIAALVTRIRTIRYFFFAILGGCVKNFGKGRCIFD